MKNDSGHSNPGLALWVIGIAAVVIALVLLFGRP